VPWAPPGPLSRQVGEQWGGLSLPLQLGGLREPKLPRVSGQGAEPQPKTVLVVHFQLERTRDGNKLFAVNP